MILHTARGGRVKCTYLSCVVLGLLTLCFFEVVRSCPLRSAKLSFYMARKNVQTLEETRESVESILSTLFARSLCPLGLHCELQSLGISH